MWQDMALVAGMMAMGIVGAVAAVYFAVPMFSITYHWWFG